MALITPIDYIFIFMEVKEEFDETIDLPSVFFSYKRKIVGQNLSQLLHISLY